MPPLEKRNLSEKQKSLQSRNQQQSGHRLLRLEINQQTLTTISTPRRAPFCAAAACCGARPKSLGWRRCRAAASAMPHQRAPTNPEETRPWACDLAVHLAHHPAARRLRGRVALAHPPDPQLTSTRRCAPEPDRRCTHASVHDHWGDGLEHEHGDSAGPRVHAARLAHRAVAVCATCTPVPGGDHEPLTGRTLMRAPSPLLCTTHARHATSHLGRKLKSTLLSCSTNLRLWLWGRAERITHFSRRSLFR